MSKQFLTVCCCLLCTIAVAQVQGNFKRRANESNEPQQYNNAVISQTNVGRPYSAVNKMALIAGENIVEFRVNALSNQRADSYTAIFNIVQLGKTAEEANTCLLYTSPSPRD